MLGLKLNHVSKRGHYCDRQVTYMCKWRYDKIFNLFYILCIKSIPACGTILRSMKISFTSFSKTGENNTNFLFFSFRYFRGKLLDFGIDFANVGLIFVKNLSNLSAISFGFVTSFSPSLNNLGNLAFVPLFMTVFRIFHDAFKSDLCYSSRSW